MAIRLIALLLLSGCASAALAQPDCRVLDPELQASYAGPCKDGFAEGFGSAYGTAEYVGEFKAGRKHGKGVKTWPSGDRYEGGFVEDRKEGVGTYVWGRGPFAGERYDGAFLADRRNGFGTYRWPFGDVYAGPWKDDAMVGQRTPMMEARVKFWAEARTAVAKEGVKVCREVPVGLAATEWLRGVVVAVNADAVGVRLDEVGTVLPLRKGDVLWDAPHAWTPCL